ncbi:MAG: hypothetical protein LUE95_03625 [Oscillospiraceae bacterium]|nr:hypothetical protein [Oscillospiraceae bacterium]
MFRQPPLANRAAGFPKIRTRSRRGDRLGFLAFLRKKICGTESEVGDFSRRGEIVYILFIFSSKFEHGKRIKCKVHETIPPKIHRFVAAKAAAGAACDSFI